MPKYIRPTSTSWVTGSFAEHVARGSVNPGIDYGTSRGTPVVAPAGGRIVSVVNTLSGSGGRMVGLDTYDGDGFDFLHLQSIAVEDGDYVNQGDLIGHTGSSANGSENGVDPHLHLSYRQRQGQHYTNAGNLDFEAYLSTPAGGITTPIERESEMDDYEENMVRREARARHYRNVETGQSAAVDVQTGYFRRNDGGAAGTAPQADLDRQLKRWENPYLIIGPTESDRYQAMAQYEWDNLIGEVNLVRKQEGWAELVSDWKPTAGELARVGK